MIKAWASTGFSQPGSNLQQMTVRETVLVGLVVFFANLNWWVLADEPKSANVPGCTFAVDNYFVDQVWTKVAAQRCLTCHKQGGDAEDSAFVLLDPERITGPQRVEAWTHNREAFARMAQRREGSESRLLLKVSGKLEHGGQEVLATDSTGYRVLADFVERIAAAPSGNPQTVKLEDMSERSFFDGIAMLDERRLFRRATLSLAGRLPTQSEYDSIALRGRPALVELLDSLLQEEAFYDRLREGFNDIFLTIGFDGGAETALAYDHFSKSRLWYQKYDLSHIADEDARRKAGYKLADDYRKAILGEPMKLIEYIVRHDRPFTEIVTADYILVTPYSARGYGIFEEVQTQFDDPEDPFEYIPVKLKALVGRNKADDQESATGFYPHAGLLSTFQYLRRYPTTETNRNRLRARMFYQHFLGIDTLELAARVSDAAAVAAKYEIPTMQAAECVVCHKTLDPVAGLFQDYYKFEGVYGRRKGGWYTDMFPAGFEGDELPEDQRWRALQWLGERTAKDPRFAVAMVEHVYYILTGRKVLLPSKAIDDPLFAARQSAYRAQRHEVNRIASRFIDSNFNLRQAFKDWIQSDTYRAEAPEVAVAEACRLAELDELGVVRLLAPEQLERKIQAIFGQRWGKLTEQMAMLYGGIDSKEVTERATDPSGAMGAIQRIMANDVACKHTGRDFGKPINERLLFPTIDHTLVPGESPEDDAAIRRAIVYLHERILGRVDAPESSEVDRSFQLLTMVVSDAAEKKGLERNEKYTCRQTTPPPPEDNHYTIRAWRAVITYLLRRPEFLYE